MSVSAPAPARISAALEPRPALLLIQQLCAELARAGIRYCHWKSNAAIDRSASGENDLDLLIAADDQHTFEALVRRLGFKQAQVAPAQAIPGIDDHYGFDRPSGRLVHVHAHYRLVLGDDMTKNYRLPIEAAYLASCTQAGLFPLPAPEFEYIVLVVRMVLKHATWDAFAARQGRLPKAARAELAYLRARIDRAHIAALLEQHLPMLDAALFAACERALEPGCPRTEQAAAGRRLQQQLQAGARRNSLADSGLKLWRRAARAVRVRVLRQAQRRRLRAGGRLVAVVGGDGAGKSTAVDALHGWLAKEFATLRLHLGRPQWSLTTRLVRAALKFGTLSGLLAVRPAPVQYGAERSYPVFPGYPAVLRELCVARDRARALARARRFAQAGGLVICDRFPLAQLRLMDGPHVEQMLAAKPHSRLDRLLIRAEQRYRRSIGTPDLLLVLRLDPELAVRRKPSEDAAAVRARNHEIWQAELPAGAAQLIDASLPPAEVLAQLREHVWGRL